MRSGGTAMPAGWTAKIAAMCTAAGTGLHLDGSRLADAAVARGETLACAAAGAFTVSLSLNKAIGAPLGAILAGPRDLVEQAAEWREMLGGNWRPVGPVAAAARAALPGWVERLTRNHRMAADLARRLRSMLGESVDVPDTAIILIGCQPGGAEDLVRRLGNRGVGALALTSNMVRLVLHGGVPPGAIPGIADAVARAWAEHEP